MLHLALWEPEIPPNTGNIARMCAAVNVRLHLIGRLGFKMDNKHLRRAGIDYWDAVDLVHHHTYKNFEAEVLPERIICIETAGVRRYTEVKYQDGDCLLFGNESSGLPKELLERFAEKTVSIPMPSGHVRSLNLATSAGIVLYEALRQVEGW